MRQTLTLIRGGGELGSAVAVALVRAGVAVVIRDRPLPGALRLGVALATAAVTGRTRVAGVVAVHCRDRAEVEDALARGRVPVLTGGELDLDPDVVVDARMRQLTEPTTRLADAPVVVGIGPGFVVGRDVHCIVESNRGPRLGRAIMRGAAEAHTGTPGVVAGQGEARLLRAPRAGTFVRAATLGDDVEIGDVVGRVDQAPVVARLRGMIRGLKLSGVVVGEGHKVGDVDPRRRRALLHEMTDKARAVGDGVVSALEQLGVLPARRVATRGRAACI